MYARLLEPSHRYRRRCLAVACHFAVVDTYCVDLLRAFSTYPSKPESLSTLSSGMSL
jgi:hypothetical protein